jgi:chemotaxis protein CheD
MVRMGEFVASRTPGDVLVSIGLGSCIGLALVDPARSIAGLAHVMLPASNGTVEARSRGKYADLAIPALVQQLVALGASVPRLQAVLVGGARMFSFSSSSLDVGARNERATLDELRRLGIRVAASETSGTSGRTIRVHVGDGRVLCRAAGGTEQLLIGTAVAGASA